MVTTKNNKKKLFVGCELTASSMFDESNRSQHHWPTLITDHYNCESINASIGGMPNEEIFYKTSEMISKEKFDLVISSFVMDTIDGVAFTLALKHQWREKAPKIILLSSELIEIPYDKSLSPNAVLINKIKDLISL